MKTCATRSQEKPRTEFYARPGALDGLRGDCKACVRVRSSTRYKANPDAHEQHTRIWRSKNSQLDRLVRRRAHTKWAKANPAHTAARNGLRYAGKLRATPAWANQFFIAEIYDLAAQRTKLLGIPWEVDHIVPLKSPLVCGLHTEHNLRAIPAAVNQQKGNRHWPDMPEVRV